MGYVIRRGQISALVVVAALMAAAPIGGAAEPNLETVEGVLGEMTTLHKTMNNLNRERESLTVAIATWMRNNDLLNKQLAGRLKPLIDTHHANSILFAANQKRLTGIIQRYNRECSGTVARAAYDRCKVQEGVLKEKSRGLTQITQFWGYHGSYAQEPPKPL